MKGRRRRPQSARRLNYQVEVYGQLRIEFVVLRAPPSLLTRVRIQSLLASIASIKPLFEPIQDFLLNPTNTVCAELYPFGKFSSFLEASDVLR